MGTQGHALMTSPALAVGALGNRRRQSSWCPPIAAIHWGWASAIAGFGGALSAYRFGSVSPATFGTFASIAFLAFAYLGGITTVAGDVVGGMFVANGIAFTALHEWFAVDAGLTNLIGGVGPGYGRLPGSRGVARLPCSRRLVASSA